MSNLSLVLVWAYEATTAAVYAGGGTIVDDRLELPPLLASPLAGSTAFRIHKADAQSLQSYHYLRGHDPHFYRLLQLSLDNRVVYLDVVDSHRLDIRMIAPLKALEAATLAARISDLFGEADVASERQDDIGTNPAWPHYQRIAC